MAGLKKLAGQTAVYGMSSIIGRFLNYLLVPLYVYTFPPEKYGIVTEFYAYVVVLQIILTYGMETGFFRFAEKSQNPDKVFTTVLTSIFSTSVLFVVLIFLFAQKISGVLGYEQHTDYVKIFALILSTDAVSAIFFARLRRLNKAVKFATFKILNIAVNIGFNLFFILLCPYLISKGFNFISFFYSESYGVGYIFLSNLFASLFVFLLFIPDLLKIKFTFDKQLLKQILLYSLPLLLTGLTGSINEMADRILLKYLTVPPDQIIDKHDYVMYQLGIYGANAKLAVVMMMFVQAFRYAAEPFFFSQAKEKKNSYKIFADVMKFYLIIAFLMFLVVLLNLDIFKYFISKEYFEGLKVVFPLFLSRLLVGVFFILSFWYKLTDLTRYGVVIFSTGAVVTLVLDFILIPKYGYIGAAWTNFSAYAVMVVFSFLWSRKYMKIPYQYFRMLFYIIFALSLYFVSQLISFNSLIIRLLLKNSLIILYIILVFKIEKLNIKNIFTTFKKTKSNAT
jgi:O-antigen/teichoic acid export membrane protein